MGRKAFSLQPSLRPNASPKKEKIGDDAYKVVTSQVKDVADSYLEEEGKTVLPTDNYTLVGYCTADNLPGFVLDPPRGKALRVVLVFFFQGS